MNDVNFILIEDQADELPELLSKRVPGFARFDQYTRLVEDKLELPGLVCGAFANYLLHLHRVTPANERSSELEEEIERCVKTIEDLVLTGDAHIENYVVTEILENIDFEEAEALGLWGRFGPATKNLYTKWFARQ